MSGKHKWSGFAVDLGASSGRVMLGGFDGDRIELREVARFDNGPVDVLGTIHWDLLRLWQEVQRGLARGVEDTRAGGGVPASVGVDTWGVDFGLVDTRGQLLGNPVHYRDDRTSGMVEKVYARVPRREVFAVTGLQTMQVNTIFQLAAMQERGDVRLAQAAGLLFIPDLLHYFLSGTQASEYTIASTSQLLDAAGRNWSWDLLARLDLPRAICKQLVEPCTVLGGLHPTVRASLETDLRVVAVGSHDTASAVAAVPATEGDDFAYISSGTWSLLGAELPRPVITPRCMELGFTNEGGLERSIRLLKNIMGLWLLQELQREWRKAGREVSWREMTSMATTARPFVCWVDPDDERFLAPGAMSGRIRDYCRESGQPEPDTDGALVRCVLESLALKYRLVLQDLDKLVERPAQVLHVVGGGARNELLCRFTANAVNRPVRAGPVEGTALGNIIAQLIAMGEIGSVREGRAVVAASFPPTTYEPEDTVVWEDAAGRFAQVLANKKG